MGFFYRELVPQIVVQLNIHLTKISKCIISVPDLICVPSNGS